MIKEWGEHVPTDNSVVEKRPLKEMAIRLLYSSGPNCPGLVAPLIDLGMAATDIPFLVSSLSFVPMDCPLSALELSGAVQQKEKGARHVWRVHIRPPSLLDNSIEQHSTYENRPEWNGLEGHKPNPMVNIGASIPRSSQNQLGLSKP